MLGFSVKDFLFICTVDGNRHAINRSHIIELEETLDYIHIHLKDMKECRSFKILQVQIPPPPPT